MTVEGALGEGIVALLANKVTIAGNFVEHNDNGGNTSGWYECEGEGNVPGDCGEGIDLFSSTNSLVKNNKSLFNSGGILL